MQTALQALMNEATLLLNDGKPAAAAQLYLRVLEGDHQCFEACFRLGTLYARLGRLPDAIAAMQKALAIRPDDPIALQACGSFLIEAGRFAQAVALFDQALVLRPNATPFHFNRALALAMSGRSEKALAGYDRAILLRPAFVEAWLARGNLLRQLGRFDDALDSLDKALGCEPGNIHAHHARGLLLTDMGRTEEALRHFDKVLEQTPVHAGVLLDRGRTLRKQGRLGEALQSFEAAIDCNANSAPALNARGTVLADLNRHAEALAAYSQALACEPDFVDALVNRGLLQWTGWRRYEEAVTDLERAVVLSPIYSYARGELFHIKMHGGDWEGFAREKQILDEGVRAGELVVRPFAYQAISDSPADLAACARIFAGLYPLRPAPGTIPHRRGTKIRVGYLCADFRNHATSYLMAGLYEQHDRNAFEIVAIDSGRDDSSPMRKRLEAAFDRFVDIADLSDLAAAERVRAVGIDILVNLNGYFGDYRMGVFAHRAAPIQVSYLGFPATLGAPYIDYLIADRIVIPEDERRFYDEQIVYLPDCYQVNDSARVRPQTIPDRADCGLPQDAFVFCNFNQSYKLTPGMFAVWMRILRQVSGSVLWLVNELPALQTNLKNAAEQQGVASDRIIFGAREPFERHLARLSLADLVLDNLPYNAHTTASDALWMGVPLITCRGTTFPGRVAASLLTTAGLEEMITENLQDYERLAVALAADKNRLTTLRQTLKSRQSCALFDTDRFRRHLEEAYRTMLARWQHGAPPRHFSVEARESETA
jgi:protein O-GlcNAc transferase